MQRISGSILPIVFVALGAASPAIAGPAPVKNIVLVHGAWVDGSGWKPVADILTKDGF